MLGKNVIDWASYMDCIAKILDPATKLEMNGQLNKIDFWAGGARIFFLVSGGIRGCEAVAGKRRA